MDALGNLQGGDLPGALAAVQQQVKSEPASAKHRIFLFQLLCLSGDWERALTQLKVLEELDAASLPMVRTYSLAIQCEGVRAEVFAGTRSPLIFGDPPAWLALLLEADRLLADGNTSESESIRAEALEKAPTVSGTLNGEAFAWIMDADPRLGPICEVIVNGKYYWAPFERIKKIAVEAPADLRDMVWLPASFEWTNGGEMLGLIPVRYPGSEKSEDPLLRLSRKTTWQDVSENTQLGLGQRLIATDQTDVALLDIREILFDTSA
jgi:type VI secretion system protein ImpE